MIFFTTVTTFTAVTTVTTENKQICFNLFIYFLRFLEEQLDTFDNRCDVLLAAFCNSRDVFVRRGCMIFGVKRLRDFLCEKRFFL